MKRLLLIAATALLCLSLQAKKALVVIAHGSPSNNWNKEVLALEGRLDRLAIPGISYKRVALMEFAQPNIASVIRDCEKQQIDTVFALPLFISPSGHAEDDIPNLLGLKFDPAVHRELAAEGAEFVHTQIRIVVGPTLIGSGVIEKALSERVKALSSNPGKEAVVLLAHGDPDRIGFWNSLLDRCAELLKTQGFDYVDYQLVGMGQNFAKDVKPLLARASKAKEKTLVQGIYLVSGVGSMAKMSGMGGAGNPNIIYGNAGILPESADDVMAWIEKATKEWLAAK